MNGFEGSDLHYLDVPCIRLPDWGFKPILRAPLIVKTPTFIGICGLKFDPECNLRYSASF